MRNGDAKEQWPLFSKARSRHSLLRLSADLVKDFWVLPPQPLAPHLCVVVRQVEVEERAEVDDSVKLTVPRSRARGPR